MFITLEGIEGSGKTTQINHIAEFLKLRGIRYIITKEPGGTAIGQKIRSILLDPDHDRIHPLTELLLYSADRIQHIKEMIAPMLEMGKTILCDRFYDSTTVYQGFSRGLDINLINHLNNLVLGGLKPDLTFLLDLPAEAGLERAWKQIKSGHRPDAETRFEKEKLVFHEKVRQGYLKLASLEPDRFAVIDALTDENRVKETILTELAKRFNFDKF